MEQNVKDFLSCVQQELLCACCMCIVVEPVSLPCNHFYCAEVGCVCVCVCVSGFSLSLFPWLVFIHHTPLQHTHTHTTPVHEACIQQVQREVSQVPPGLQAAPAHGGPLCAQAHGAIPQTALGSV
jgi:hypothetical protein